MIKIAAAAVIGLGLCTGLYASAVVVPEYREAESEWVRAPRDASRTRLEDARYALRDRGQQCGMAVIGLGVVGLGLALVSRKKPGQPPFPVLVGGAAVTLATFGIIQGIGNVF
ncbi:MAG: hypothetical protein QM723_27070 [Myxococcaceae bacterium]